MGLDASFDVEVCYYRKWHTLNQWLLDLYKSIYGDLEDCDFEMEVTLDMLKEFKRYLLSTKNDVDAGDMCEFDYRKTFINKDFKKLRKLIFKGYRIYYRANW